MSKSYGPQGFEKAFIKRLTGFNETKIFFFHDKSKTTVKYINKRSLIGIEMYRDDYEMDKWIGHFQNYLDTGTFDTNAYWYGHNSVKDADGKWEDTILSPVVPIPMKLEKKLWSVHSPAHNRYMAEERANIDKGMGFKQVPRPCIKHRGPIATR